MNTINGYCLRIWSRDDRTQDDPTEIIIAETLHLLKLLLIDYFKKYAELDDFLEGDEIEKTHNEATDEILDINLNLDTHFFHTTYPELNTVFRATLSNVLIN